jgi:hypothetical protein
MLTRQYPPNPSLKHLNLPMVKVYYHLKETALFYIQNANIKVDHYKFANKIQILISSFNLSIFQKDL